jgi:hypothetical protein
VNVVEDVNEIFIAGDSTMMMFVPLLIAFIAPSAEGKASMASNLRMG